MIRSTPKQLSFFSSTHKESLWGYIQNKGSGPSVNHTISSFAITLQCNKSKTTFKQEQQVIEDFKRKKEEAYETGYAKGTADGRTRGYQTGYEEGLIDGQIKGFWNGVRSSVIHISAAFGIYSLFNRLLYGQK